MTEIRPILMHPLSLLLAIQFYKLVYLLLTKVRIMFNTPNLNIHLLFTSDFVTFNILQQILGRSGRHEGVCCSHGIASGNGNFKILHCSIELSRIVFNKGIFATFLISRNLLSLSLGLILILLHNNSY